MSTLSILKARIADDLARSDLTSQIANEINSAITFYQEERFFFAENRTKTFDTVSGRASYTTDDDADIPLMREVDAVFCTDGNGQQWTLDRDTPENLQALIGDAGAMTGQPYSYARFDDGFLIYPIPDGVYTILPMGHIEVDAPSADDETGNPWMTKAFELIRCRAKAMLYTHVLKDLAQAQTMSSAEDAAREALRRATSTKSGAGHIVPTQF
jgi:hypothetical protein